MKSGSESRVGSWVESRVKPWVKAGSVSRVGSWAGSWVKAGSETRLVSVEVSRVKAEVVLMIHEMPLVLLQMVHA